MILYLDQGNMSLVGPRPLPVKYLPRFNTFQKKRMNVKPGVTGLAQINGRNVLSWEDRFNYDIEYLQRQTCLLDLKIIFLTILFVLNRKDIDGVDQEIMSEFMGSDKK